jgi:predicted transcriptional regulator of viral defense system
MDVKRELGVGSAEAALLTDLERAEIPVLSLPRHRSLLGDFDDARLHKTIHRLVVKGWLQRIESGKYVVVPRAARGGWHEHPFIIAAAITPTPYYISYWSALSHHDLTEQLPRGVFVAVLGGRKRALRFQGWSYRFIHRTQRSFYGFQEQEMVGLNGAARVGVAIADPEKAILDSLDDEILAGGFAEIVKAIQRGLTDEVLAIDRLVEYALRYPNKAVVARLGYILTRSEIPAAGELRRIIRKTGYPPRLSATASDRNAHRDRIWNVLVNVPDVIFGDVA